MRDALRRAAADDKSLLTAQVPSWAIEAGEEDVEAERGAADTAAVTALTIPYWPPSTLLLLLLSPSLSLLLSALPPVSSNEKGGRPTDDTDWIGPPGEKGALIQGEERKKDDESSEESTWKREEVDSEPTPTGGANMPSTPAEVEEGEAGVEQ